MKGAKFRTPTKCQNQHFRWYYYTVSFGRCEPVWGPKNCDCPTGDLHQGFRMVGPDQQFTGLRDFRGEEIFEGDILEVSRKGLRGFGNRFEVFHFENEASFIEGEDGGPLTLASIDSGHFVVVGNNYDGTALEKGIIYFTSPLKFASIGL